MGEPWCVVGVYAEVWVRSKTKVHAKYHGSKLCFAALLSISVCINQHTKQKESLTTHVHAETSFFVTFHFAGFEHVALI